MTGYITLRFRLSMINFLAVFFTSLLYTHQLNAEQLLSLEDAINIALEQGYLMKSIRLGLVQAEENRLAAKYRFRTNADMTFNAPAWEERVMSIQVPNALPVYNSLGTMRVQGLLNINQPLPTDGTLTLRSRLYQSKESNYFAETDNTLKRKDFVTSMSLWFNQPLFTFNRLKTGLKRAELNYENSLLSFQRTQLDVIYNVTQSFYGLYRQTRIYEINHETMEQMEKTYDLAKLKYEAGLIPEVEALQMEVDLADARASFYAAESDLERQKDDFKQTLGLKLSDDVGIKTDISYKHFTIDTDKAIEEGLKNRYEIRENEIDIELRRIAVMESNARNEIRADLSAYYDFTGRSDPALPYNSGTQDLFDSSWDDLERRPANRGVSLILTLPVWDWGVNKAEVASARANLQRAEIDLEEQKKSIENSIRDVVRSVRSSESRLEVLTKSQDVAQRTYNISLERFNNGEITSLELSLDNNRLSSSKLAFLNAYIAYKLAVSDLKRKTFWDFENNRPLLDL